VPDHPKEYDVAALQEALAEDEETAELGLEVVARGEELYLTGLVASTARKEAVGRVAQRHAGHLHVHNDLRVEDPGAPREAEELS
jgi:osmotically-inducible protein OsmY